MAVIVVDVVSPQEQLGESHPITTVIEVVSGTTSPIETSSTTSAVDVVMPGGTVVNATYGFEFPSNPQEGMIFIKLQEE